jgi:hypothetical protein
VEVNTMDTTEFSEGKYITPLLVNKSPTKKCIILDEAKPEKTDFGEQLVCHVEIDGKGKLWRMNMDSVKNMQRINIDSRFWREKSVQFLVTMVKGKEVVIGSPILPVEGVI